MSMRTDIRDAAAQTALAVCMTFGDTITYSDRGGAAVTLYAAPDDESVADVNILGLEADQTTRRFTVPKQANFPPTNGIRTGAEIKYPTTAAYSYFVVSAEADTLGAAYTVTTTRKHATRLN
jgi:hypothetical protein